MPQRTEPSGLVLPPAANTVLALAWIILLGGRSVIGTWLVASGAVRPEQMAAWDDGVLLRVYLALLAVTIIVVALRIVRRAGNHDRREAARN